MKNKKLKIGLALGSGGARGLSHIGVLKILEKNNIPIDLIAGSSMGALVGGFYSAGISIENIEKIAVSTNWKKIVSLVDVSPSAIGFVEGEKVKKFIKENVGNKKFNECKIPFVAIATDIKNGESVILKEGEIGDAIRASISIPLLFKPIRLRGRLLADGGLSVPVPVSILKDMGADIVIAVNVNENYLNNTQIKKDNIYNVTQNYIRILNKNLASLNVSKADIVINPDVRNTDWSHFIDGKRLIKVGENATVEVLEKIKNLIN
jgi:NTE family protein